MGTVGLVFSPLAPLVVIAAAVVFWVSSWVYKYQLMFVFVTRVETGGVSGYLEEHVACIETFVYRDYGTWSSTVSSRQLSSCKC